jgi:hypothetical protein
MRCLCRVMLPIMPPRQLGHDAMSVLSRASDDAAEATWSDLHINIEKIIK